MNTSQRFMNDSTQQKAIIYCRVSSARQASEGHGLESQEHRCRIFAAERNFLIDKIFSDSYTGGGNFINRPAMKELIKFLDKNRHENYVVIFDDLKRFARDTIFHWQLRSELKVRSATPLCLNYNFDDTPEGTFVETIFAAQNQLEREQNRRQVIQKMKARLEKGFWAFCPPVGYTWTTDKINGRILIRDSKATLIKEALEGFATDKFSTQTDVRAFLISKRFNDGKGLSLSSVHVLFRRLLYTGYIEYPSWKVTRRLGNHDPIISLETFNAIQDKLDGNQKNYNMKNVHEDFPLRGFVLCAGCMKPYTSNWSRGRSKLYPFYRCNQKGCSCYGKSVRREILESAFQNVLTSVTPNDDTLVIMNDKFNTRWEAKVRLLKEYKEKIQCELVGLNNNLMKLMNRMATATDGVADIYDNQIEKITKQKFVLEEKLRPKVAESNLTVETAYQSFIELIKNPYKTWVEKSFKTKKLLLKIVFEKPLIYDSKKGFETGILRYSIKAFQEILNTSSMAVHSTSQSENHQEIPFEINWPLFEKEILEFAKMKTEIDVS